MVSSMTGYGRGEAAGPSGRLAVELKSVNHRFCEVVARLPKGLSALEDRVRREVQGAVSRGRVEVYVTRQESEGPRYGVSIDKPLALAYYNNLKELAAELGLNGGISLDLLGRLPEVFILREAVDDPEGLWGPLAQALEAGLRELVDMRRREGEALARDLAGRLAKLQALGREIAARAPEVPREHRLRLQKRLQELAPPVALDESRLAAEVALFADRSDISEEIARLASHLSQFTRILGEAEAVGRKLDFLVQELHRELNTIGSKASDLEIGNLVLLAKTELERIREQVQNVE